MSLILASSSATRANMLRAAGLEIEIDPPRVDEEQVKLGLRAEGLSVRDQADALAEMKALSVARRRGGYVLGADQMLALEGQAFDKPANREDARAHLRALSGKTHQLVTAAVLAKDGAPIWRVVDTPKLTMRSLSEAFIETYLDRLGEGALKSVGAYQLEGLGAQLFTKVEGDFFSILGLPLLPLLDVLRLHGVVEG